MEKASIVVAHKSKEEVEVLYVGTNYAKALEVLAAAPWSGQSFTNWGPGG